MSEKGSSADGEYGCSMGLRAHKKGLSMGNMSNVLRAPIELPCCQLLANFIVLAGINTRAGSEGLLLTTFILIFIVTHCSSSATPSRDGKDRRCMSPTPP